MRSAEFDKKIDGPLTTVAIPFQEGTYEVDYLAFEVVIDWWLEHGVKIFLLTAGSSEFLLMSEEEIRKVTEILVKKVKGRRTVIAANGYWGMKQSADFAKFAGDLGVDGVLITYPQREMDHDTQYEFMEYVAKASSVPVLTHVFDNLGTGLPPVELLSRIANIDNVVGFKDDSSNYYYLFTLLMKLKDKLSAIGGGSKLNCLYAYPYGLYTYLTTMGLVCPRIPNDFYSALKRGDYEEAKKFVTDYEYPFFEVHLRIGEPAAYKVMMNLAGLPVKPVVRPPCGKKISAEEVENLRKVMLRLGMIG